MFIMFSRFLKSMAPLEPPNTTEGSGSCSLKLMVHLKSLEHHGNWALGYYAERRLPLIQPMSIFPILLSLLTYLLTSLGGAFQNEFRLTLA